MPCCYLCMPTSGMKSSMTGAMSPPLWPFQRLVNREHDFGGDGILGLSGYTAKDWVGVDELAGTMKEYRHEDGTEISTRKTLTEEKVTKKGDTFVLADDDSIRVDAVVQNVQEPRKCDQSR